MEYVFRGQPQSISQTGFACCHAAPQFLWQAIDDTPAQIYLCAIYCSSFERRDQPVLRRRPEPKFFTVQKDRLDLDDGICWQVLNIRNFDCAQRGKSCRINFQVTSTTESEAPGRMD